MTGIVTALQIESYQLQIKDDLKTARIGAARRTEEFVELPKTSQRREGLDRELESRPQQDQRDNGKDNAANTENCRTFPVEDNREDHRDHEVHAGDDRYQ